jgi:hypothetical protein
LRNNEEKEAGCGYDEADCENHPGEGLGEFVHAMMMS